MQAPHEPQSTNSADGFEEDSSARPVDSMAQQFARLVELQASREMVFELLKTASSRIAIMRQFLTRQLYPPTTQQLYYLLSKQILPRELIPSIQEFITQRREMMGYIETLTEAEQLQAYTAGLNVATGLGTFFDLRYEGRPGEGFRDEMRRKMGELSPSVHGARPIDPKEPLYSILDSDEPDTDIVDAVLTDLEAQITSDPDYVLQMLAYTNHRSENLGHRMMLEKIGIRSEEEDEANKILYAMRYFNLLIPLAARATAEQVELLFVIVSARSNVWVNIHVDLVGDLTLGIAVCKTESADLQKFYFDLVKHLAEKTDTDRIAHPLLGHRPARDEPGSIPQLCRLIPALTDNFVTLLGELYNTKKLSVHDTAELLCKSYQTTPAHAKADALLLKLTREGAFRYEASGARLFAYLLHSTPLNQHAEFTSHLMKLINNLSDPEERLTLIHEATAQEASPLWALFNPVDRIEPFFGSARSELRAFDKEPLRSLVALADNASTAAVVVVPTKNREAMQNATTHQGDFVAAIENPGELSHLRTVLSSDDTAATSSVRAGTSIQKELLISTLGFEYATGHTIFDGIVIAAEGDPEKLRSVLTHLHCLLNQHDATGQEIRALFNRTETFYALMRVIAQNEITGLPDLLFDCIAHEIFPPALLPQIRDLHKRRVAFKDKILALPDNAKKLRLLRMSQDRFSVLGRFYDFWAGSTSPNGLKEELAKALARFNAPTVDTTPTLRARLFEILDSEKGVKYSDVEAFIAHLESMLDTDPDQLVQLLLLNNHREQNLGNRLPAGDLRELGSSPPHGEIKEHDDKPDPTGLLKRYLAILNRVLDIPEYFNAVETILLNRRGSYDSLPATIACSAGEHQLDEVYFPILQKLRDNFGNESLNRLLTAYLVSVPKKYKINNYYIPHLVKLYEDKMLSVSGATTLFARVYCNTHAVTPLMRGLLLRLVRDGGFCQSNLSRHSRHAYSSYFHEEDLTGEVTKAIEAIADPAEKQAVIYEALNEPVSPLYRFYQPLRSQRDIRRGVLSVPSSLNENPLIALVRLAQGLSQPQEVAVVVEGSSAPTVGSAGGLFGRLSGLFSRNAPALENADGDDNGAEGPAGELQEGPPA